MTTPDRGSNKSGPRLDDERKKEVEGQVRSGHPTRAEDWHEPEPPVDPPPFEDHPKGRGRGRGAPEAEPRQRRGQAREEP